MLQGEHLFQAPDGRTPRMDAHAKGSQVPQRGGGALCPASHFQRPPTRPFPAPFRLEEKEGCQEGAPPHPPLRWAPPSLPEEEARHCLLLGGSLPGVA